MNRNVFVVEIVTNDRITDDKDISEMEENIARAIVNEVNSGMGIVPKNSVTFTTIVYVRGSHSNTTAIEHP